MLMRWLNSVEELESRAVALLLELLMNVRFSCLVTCCGKWSAIGMDSCCCSFFNSCGIS